MKEKRKNHNNRYDFEERFYVRVQLLQFCSVFVVS